MAAAALTILSSSAPTPPTSPRPRARARARINLKPRLHLLPGAAALGALLANGGAALAAPLSYDETLRLSTDSGGGGGGEFALPDLGIGGVIDFVTENPIVAAASVAAVALPVILARALGGGGGSKPYGVVSAAAAYRTLVEEPGAQLVDIRAPGEARETGSPDLREARKKAAAVPYDGEDKNGFLKRISLRFKDPENTTLVILDKFDGNSELVAELLTANGYKAALAVKDGAEGRRGWQKSDLPWAAPSKGFSLSGLIGDGTDGLPVTLGLAAATGLGILAYTEIETVLQFLGSAAIVQLIASKLIYAEDRKKTLKQIDDFFNKKVAPKELVDEIKEIGSATFYWYQEPTSNNRSSSSGCHSYCRTTCSTGRSHYRGTSCGPTGRSHYRGTSCGANTSFAIPKLSGSQTTILSFTTGTS
uniref:Protein THYLAKOID RHODANESE-LIKE, chloroplastic n=1 Tax=Leersia perrieri TaxID=77586 RepID=A0A0D9VEF4_9ORYZ